MRVKHPELLSPNLRPERPINALSLSLNISLRDRSQASMSVSSGDSPIKMGAFINVYTAKGLQGVYRATNISMTNAKGRVYTLTHAIDTLRNDIWTMQGAFDGTRGEFLSALLSHQKTIRWQLGTVDMPETPYKSANINYTKLSDVFSKFVSDNLDIYPEYDFSTVPWTLNIKALPQDVAARFSLTRNATTCSIVYDDKNQCNRLYLSVNTPEKVNGMTKYTPELKIYENAEAIAQNGGVPIEKTASVKTDEITGGDADKWAADFLEKYSEPEVSISVDGYELWKQTGEIFDEAAVGKRASVHLPEHGVTTIQRIEAVNYPDVLKSPTAIAVSLATKHKSFTTAISNLEKEVEKAGGAAGGVALSAANAEEVTAWSLIMQKVKEAVDGTGIEQIWESGIIIDAVEGTKIYSLKAGMETAFSQIGINANKILLQSEEIELKADKIELNGLVKVSQLEATKAEIAAATLTGVTTNVLSARDANTQYLSAESSFSFAGSLMSKKPISMGPITTGQVLCVSTASLDLAHSHAVSVADDGTVTLGEVSETGGNFRIADTKAYKAGVAAAKASVTLSSAGWINGVNTVTASNDKIYPVELPSFSVSGGTSFNAEHKTTVYFSTASVSSPLKSIEVDASSVYAAGYEAGKAEADTTAAYAEGWAAAKARFSMTWPDQGSYDYLLNITQPGATPEDADVVDQLQIGATYSLNAITNTAPNTFYTSGWAYARTRLNGGSWTNRHRVNMTRTTTINVGQS